jgi:HSP20 family protein
VIIFYVLFNNSRKEGLNMAIVHWQQGELSEFDRLRQEIDRLTNPFSSGREPFLSRVYPALNLTEEGDNFLVRAELPGVKGENLDVSVVEGRLVIRGERKIEMEGKETNYHRRERGGRFFRRTIGLPAKVAPDKVSASLKNGVLTITLPKSEEAKPRKIAVKST